MIGFKIRHVSRAGRKEERADAEGLHIGTAKTIKIVPVVAGSGGLERCLAGVALIGLSYWLPGVSSLELNCSGEQPQRSALSSALLVLRGPLGCLKCPFPLPKGIRQP